MHSFYKKCFWPKPLLVLSRFQYPNYVKTLQSSGSQTFLFIYIAVPCHNYFFESGSPEAMIIFYDKHTFTEMKYHKFDTVYQDKDSNRRLQPLAVFPKALLGPLRDRSSQPGNHYYKEYSYSYKEFV